MFKGMKQFFFLKVSDEYREDFAVEICRANLFRVGIYLLLNIAFKIIMPLLAFTHDLTSFLWVNNFYYALIEVAILLLMIIGYMYIKRTQKDIEHRYKKINNALAIFLLVVLSAHSILALYETSFSKYDGYSYILIMFMIAILTYLPPLKFFLIYFPAHLIYIAAAFLSRKHFGFYPESIISSTIVLAGAFILSRVFYLAKYKETVARLLIHQKNAKLEELNKKLEYYSFNDDLTGLYNRRKLDELLTKEWNRCMRYGFPISLLLVDIDNFKCFNDKHGHSAGDECLAQIGSLLKGSARRASDIVARYGGEEFIIVLPHIDGNEAFDFAETIRKSVQAHQIRWKGREEHRSITISIGICTVIPNNGYDINDLIFSADRALYKSKETKNLTMAAEIIKAEEMPELILTEAETN